MMPHAHTPVLARKVSAPAYNLYSERNALFIGSTSSHSSGTELILCHSIWPRMKFRATLHSLRNPESPVLIFRRSANGVMLSGSRNLSDDGQIHDIAVSSSIGLRKFSLSRISQSTVSTIALNNRCRSISGAKVREWPSTYCRRRHPSNCTVFFVGASWACRCHRRSD